VNVRQDFVPALAAVRMSLFRDEGAGAAERKEVDEEKKRVVDRRSPEREVEDTRRRVKGRAEGGSALREGLLDEIEAALPATLDLSGRTELTTAELKELLDANPRASILKLDRCTVFSPRGSRLPAVSHALHTAMHHLVPANLPQREQGVCPTPDQPPSISRPCRQA